MKKKKRFSILKLFMSIICIASIVVSAAINFWLFKDNITPNLMGRRVYVVGEDNPMVGDINTGAALIAMDAANVSVATGDIILCYPADDPSNLCLRSVSFIATSDSGAESYYTKDSFHEDNVDSITKDRVIAVCTGYPESMELGRFITFAKSLNGMIVMLGVAGLLLVIFIISAIVKAKSDDDEEDEYGFYSYDEGSSKKKKSGRNGAPLYDSKEDNVSDPDFERKKMSISENFKQKQVNPDSSYQKLREIEHTMQFVAQRNVALSNTMAFASAANADAAFASRSRDNQNSPAPTADALREEMLRRNAVAENSALSYNVRNSHARDPITDNTGVLTAAQIAELRNGTAPASQPAEPKPEPAPERSRPEPKPVEHKSTTPDISDILKKTGPSRSKSVSDMSVDDLLKMIEEEKKKL